MEKQDNGIVCTDAKQESEKELLRRVVFKSILHWFCALAVFAIAAVVFFSFFRVYRVNGDSMKPTFNNGDILLVSASDDVAYKKGDIVLAEVDSALIVKRIVASANQTVEIDYINQELIIDGTVIEEDYISDMSFPPLNEISYPYTVPAGCVFVLGDNRIDSRDSRNANIKAIPLENIVGKVCARVFPVADFKLISGDKDA